MSPDEMKAARDMLDADPNADGVECECADGTVWELHRSRNNGEPRQYVGEELEQWRALQVYLKERETAAKQQAGAGAR